MEPIHLVYHKRTMHDVIDEKKILDRLETSLNISSPLSLSSLKEWTSAASEGWKELNDFLSSEKQFYVGFEPWWKKILSDLIDLPSTGRQFWEKYKEFHVAIRSVLHHLFKLRTIFKFLDFNSDESIFRTQMTTISFFIHEIGSSWNHTHSEKTIEALQQMDVGEVKKVELPAGPVYVHKNQEAPHGEHLATRPNKQDINNHVSRSQSAPVFWTMARASVSCAQEHKFNVYAWSGKGTGKEYQDRIIDEMIQEDGKKNFVAGFHQTSKLGSLFAIYMLELHWDPIIADLKKILIDLINERKDSYWEERKKTRADLGMLDYPAFQKEVVNYLDKQILSARKILNFKFPENTKLVNKLLPLTTAGCCNLFPENGKHSGPQEGNISMLITNKKKCETTIQSSKKYFKELNEYVEQYPSEFLDRVKKRLEYKGCGEENLLNTLLSELLKLHNTDGIPFASYTVELTALDRNHLKNQRGKSFCDQCEVKTRFFFSPSRLSLPTWALTG
eukprot:TRINITY_DN8558_c0_g1_i1.p1 TRINITY_DN8558_c0_g1~~TRINITY_DN8558_c0_g1_i1.p1  ORF type:complete len:503 (-),score=54.93 TRINITY_DN8558_c0_g1_i1:162-1670(-)